MKKEIFKRFEGGFENFSTKRFIEIDITPSVYIIVDNQWNETFEYPPPMVNGGYREEFKLLNKEIEHYQIIKQYPFHIKYCDFWHNDVQKQCFIICSFA